MPSSTSSTTSLPYTDTDAAFSSSATEYSSSLGARSSSGAAGLCLSSGETFTPLSTASVDFESASVTPLHNFPTAALSPAAATSPSTAGTAVLDKPPPGQRDTARDRFNPLTGARLVAGVVCLSSPATHPGEPPGRYVLTISSSRHADKLVLPKGGWETHESCAAAALRELWEEAGVRINTVTRFLLHMEDPRPPKDYAKNADASFVPLSPLLVEHSQPQPQPQMQSQAAAGSFPGGPISIDANACGSAAGEGAGASAGPAESIDGQPTPGGVTRYKGMCFDTSVVPKRAEYHFFEASVRHPRVRHRAGGAVAAAGTALTADGAVVAGAANGKRGLASAADGEERDRCEALISGHMGVGSDGAGDRGGRGDRGRGEEGEAGEVGEVGEVGEEGVMIDWPERAKRSRHWLTFDQAVRRLAKRPEMLEAVRRSSMLR